MNLRGRIGRLETRTGSRHGPRQCASCGFPLPVSVQPREVRFVVPPPRLIGEPEEPCDDHCAACGRRIVFRLLPPRAIEGNAAAALQP